MVLYNGIVLTISLYWMAGEDVSLFLSMLLGGDARAWRARSRVVMGIQ